MSAGGGSGGDGVLIGGVSGGGGLVAKMVQPPLPTWTRWPLLIELGR